jgi:hypothetical protein
VQREEKEEKITKEGQRRRGRSIVFMLHIFLIFSLGTVRVHLVFDKLMYLHTILEFSQLLQRLRDGQKGPWEETQDLDLTPIWSCDVSRRLTFS